MKKFFENYGFVALTAIVIIVLIIMASPVGNAIENGTTSIVGSFQNQVINSSKEIGNWVKTDIPYKVNHYLMNLDGSTYTLDSTENLTGIGESMITPNTKEYTYFTAPTKQTVTVNSDGSTVVNYYYERNKYFLDIDGILDGNYKVNIHQYGTFDVIVNGKQILQDAYDHCQKYYYGTPYEIKDIKALPGYEFKGVREGDSLKGVVDHKTHDVYLIFDTIK